MTRRPSVWTGSALAALVALVPAAAQEPAAAPALVVPSLAAPTVDARIGEDEWKGAAAFAVERGGHLVGGVRVLRSGRQIYVAYEGKTSPWGIGLRFEFVDPVSGRSNLVLITPLSPANPPITLYRKLADRDADRLPPTGCDIRFAFGEGAFSFELRVPLDQLEIGATEKPYHFTFGAWNMAEDRVVATWPQGDGGGTVESAVAVLTSEGAWGAAEPAQADPPPNEGLVLLADVGSSTETGPAFPAKAGWLDGRRDDAALEAFEERAIRAGKACPDMILVRLLLAQIRLARNDFAGALEALDELEADIPQLAATPPHILIRMQLLRDVGRYGDAAALLAGRAGNLQGDAVAAREKVVLEGLREAWRLEQEMRKAEAERDDLPRVLVKTNKGEFTVELFEDDAPNGVANFIALVESGIYDGTRFHWVEGAGRIVGGDPNSRNEDPFDDGYGDPGHLIESDPGRRMIFPMTLSFADKRRKRRSEGCIFSIHLSPSPDEDGVNTVLGRVVAGEDVVRRIEYRDTISKATVLRKRPHPYLPVKR